MQIKKLCIIGVGLIGGSLALSLKKSGSVGTIVGTGRNQENLNDALELNIIDHATQDVTEAVADADVIVLSVPVGATESVCRQIKNSISDGAILTDVGSTKTSVLKQIERCFGQIPPWFVPGHPIAGTENSGARAAFADLFNNRRVVLTPLKNTDPDAVKTIRAMWEVTGAEVEMLDPQLHDEVLAHCSHLPHVLAFALVDYLAADSKSEAIFRFAAGGFEDFTRIAASDPQMWSDICLGNREAILQSLDGYQAKLDELRQLLLQGEAEELTSLFRRAKTTRDSLRE